jgi:hypothetical protein
MFADGTKEEAMTKRRRVVCAACRSSKTGAMVLGPRHMDNVMRVHVKLTPNHDYHDFDDQGFIDQWGVYMGREEAWVVAKAANQIVYRCGGDDRNGGTLYSENLY